MVQIYRVAATEAVGRAGYTARYIADLTFQRPLHTCGVILVDITERGRSSPHAHEKLEEVFIAITDINMYVNETCFNLKAGDVVIVSPGETHSFEITLHRCPASFRPFNFLISYDLKQVRHYSGN